MSETREPVAWLYRPVGASPWEPWTKTATKADVDVLDLEQWTIQPLYTAPPTGEECSAVPEQSSATVDAGEIAVLRGDVERLTHERDEARAEAERRLGYMQLLAKEIDLWKAAFPCSTPEQMLSGRRFMDARIHELTRERDGWRSDAERMTAERDAAQREQERLQELLTEESKSLPKLIDSMTSQLRATADRVTTERDEARAERDAAQAEVQRLKEQVAALTLAVEQADEMKAHAEAAAVREEAETDRVVADGNKALAEVERLTAERDEARDERDAWQRERERVQILLRCERQELSTLRERLRQMRRDQSAQNLDMGNGQAILDSSRPDDETIWRDAFMRQLHDDHVPNWATTADVALAEYRKRWPR